MYRVDVRISLRESILDPQGKAICHALHDLGMEQITAVRTGKVMALTIQAKSAEDASAAAELACHKLLANPVTEDFEVLSVRPAIEASAFA